MEAIQKKVCGMGEESINSEFSNIFVKRILEYFQDDNKLRDVALSLIDNLKPITADKITGIIDFLNNNHHAHIEATDIFNTNKDIDRIHLAKTILASEDIPKLYSKQFAKRIEGEETSSEVVFMKACSIYVNNLVNSSFLGILKI